MLSNQSRSTEEAFCGIQEKADVSMTEKLNSRLNEIYIPVTDLPEKITEKYTVVSCLKHSEERQIYLLLDNATGAKAILKCGKDKNGELLKKEYDILTAVGNADVFPTPLVYLTENGVHYYVREYAEGITLDELVNRRGILPPLEARAAVAEICSMVQQLHDAKPPVICRDIKPENIVACPDGRYRLIDLDTARYVRGDTDHDTHQLGTQDVAAPEQYGYLQSSERTDIYALGMLLLYLLTGSYNKSAELAQKERMIVEKCTAFEPKRRYASVSALRKAIVGRDFRIPFITCLAALLCVTAALICMLI